MKIDGSRVSDLAIFLPAQFIFNTRDPIVVGVVVEQGIVRPGTPLCVPGKEVSRP